ncbi:MAG: c-type cytochrome, partial [Halioglobus sp.]|nr:c-type cytochrome [Halioglobus sp.]
EEPTIVRMRNRVDGNGREVGFAEVKIYADRAEGRVVNPAGETVFEPVALPESARHSFTGLTRGGYVVLSVGEKDALRMDVSGLDERGQLRILPASCSERFSIGDLAWYSLKDKPPEPLFYETLDNEPAPVLSPAEALEAFRIAPGFEIELVASEPLVEEPVAMSWDEFGRLYVVELRGYMRDAYGTGSEDPVGQVVRLEDTDGDGRMDTSEVFLGELVNPRAVAVVNEGVLIAEPPNLWLCELRDRDALCSDKRSVGGYATDVGAANVEHMENGLLQGLDNWLYNAKSSRRLRLQNGELLAEEGPYRGQWGITKDNQGRLLYNHNSTWVQGDFFQGEDIVVPGRTSRVKGLGENLTPAPQVYSVRVNPGVNRAYLDNTLREDGRLFRTTGVSGLVAYRGNQFPAQYMGDVFVPESAGNVVAQFAMAQDGLALTATQRLYDDERWGKRDFLGSTDERFRPVDAKNGPDGALYIIDMYRGIIQDDHFLTDELRDQIFQRGLETPIGLGRIWRVRHTGGEATRAVSLGGASDERLIESLSHANGWVRDTAQRLLLARRANLKSQLTEVAVGDDALGALHAIWALEGRGELDADLVMRLTAAPDVQRQAHALRAGGELLGNEQLIALVDALKGVPLASMQLAFTLASRSDDAQVRRALLALLQEHWDDPFTRQAVVRAVHGQELAFLQEVFAAQAMAERSAAKGAVLRDLAANAYRTLRGDLSATEPANPQLGELLALAHSRGKADAWQQVMLLKGFESVTSVQGFVPAALAAAPPIFTDSSVSESNPLWQARLSGRSAFTWPGDELALGIKPLSPEQMKVVERGKAFYVKCAACHGDDGAGVSGLAPALAGASWVTGPPEWLARIILQGMSGPVEVNGETFDGVMPPHGHLAELDDATLAGLMTYMRRSWGNKADPVSVETAAAIRTASQDRQAPWTAAELEAVPFDRGYGRFVGKYNVSFVNITVEEKPDGLYMSVPMYGGGKLQPLGGASFKGEAGSESVRIDFVVEEGGAVNKLVLLRKGERIPFERVQ